MLLLQVALWRFPLKSRIFSATFLSFLFHFPDPLRGLEGKIQSPSSEDASLKDRSLALGFECPSHPDSVEFAEESMWSFMQCWDLNHKYDGTLVVHIYSVPWNIGGFPINNIIFGMIEDSWSSVRFSCFPFQGWPKQFAVISLLFAKHYLPLLTIIYHSNHCLHFLTIILLFYSTFAVAPGFDSPRVLGLWVHRFTFVVTCKHARVVTLILDQPTKTRGLQ